MRTSCGEQGDCDLTDIQGMPAWGVVHVSYYNWTASKNVSNLFKLRIGRKQLSYGVMTNRVALWSGVGGAVKIWQVSVVRFHFDRGCWSALIERICSFTGINLRQLHWQWRWLAPLEVFAGSGRKFSKSMCHVDSTSLDNKLHSTSCSEVSVDSPHFLLVCGSRTVWRALRETSLKQFRNK